MYIKMPFQIYFGKFWLNVYIKKWAYISWKIENYSQLWTDLQEMRKLGWLSITYERVLDYCIENIVCIVQEIWSDYIKIVS